MEMKTIHENRNYTWKWKLYLHIPRLSDLSEIHGLVYGSLLCLDYEIWGSDWAWEECHTS